MRTLDLLSLSTRMFRTRALRTSLTILGVSVGIGTIVFLVSLGYGLQALLLEQITTSESLLSLDVFPPDSEVVVLDKTTLADFAALQDVKEIVPVAVLPVQLTVGESTTDATGNIAPLAFFRLSGMSVEKGKFYEEDDKSNIVISSTLAELFSWTPESAIGKSVSLTAFYEQTDKEKKKLTEGELLEAKKETRISGVVKGESPFIYLPPSVFPEIPTGTYAQAKVKVTNADVLEHVRETILEKGFTVLALSDVVEQANKIFNMLQIVLGIFGAAALIVSAIGMFNTMTIAFLERTQEIGIMRSLGASRSDMFLLFLIESAIMGFLGGVGGVGIGYLVQWLVNFGIDMLARTLGGSPVDIFLTPLWFVVVVIAFSSVVGFFTGILPGRRASKLNPLDALRYK